MAKTQRLDTWRPLPHANAVAMYNVGWALPTNLSLTISDIQFFNIQSYGPFIFIFSTDILQTGIFQSKRLYKTSTTPTATGRALFTRWWVRVTGVTRIAGVTGKHFQVNIDRIRKWLVRVVI